MQNSQRFWRSVGAVVVVVIGLIVAAMTPVAQAGSSNPNPKVLPVGSNPYGNTYGEWSARWWQWALSIPAATNPVLDETGANCAEGQIGQVWFLAGSFFGGTFDRACTVPPGKALFFPIVNAAFGAAVFDCEPTNPGVPCDVTALRAAAAASMDPVTIEASIDGVPLRNLIDYRVQSPVFSVTLPIGGDQSQIDLNGLLHGGIVKALGHACTVGLVSDLFADLGQVILAVGVLDMSQELSAFAHQVCSAPEQVAGGAHACGIDIGLWQHAAAQQGGSLLRIDFVRFGFATVDGFHLEGVSQDEGNALCRAEVGEPIPGEDAFNSDDEAITIGGNGLERLPERLSYCGAAGRHRRGSRYRHTSSGHAGRSRSKMDAYGCRIA